MKTCVLCFLTLVAASCATHLPCTSEAGGNLPPTLAAIRRGFVVASQDTNSWREANVLVPIATFKAGRWIPADKLDDPPDTVSSTAPIASLPHGQAQYWRALAGQSFYSIEDPATCFTPDKVVLYCSYDTLLLV